MDARSAERRGHKKRILIVDDEPSFTTLLRMNLELTGRYEVRTENRGARALETAEAFAPDVILLDLIMPDQDGASVAEQFKQFSRLKDVPIVFVTALVSKQEAQASRGMIGGHLFIAKPVSARDVLGHIERYMANGEVGNGRGSAAQIHFDRGG